MEFDIKKRGHINYSKYDEKDIDVAYSFSRDIYRELENFIKAIVLFGSSARKEGKSNDIDILIIVDDTKVVWTQELVEAYRIISEKTVQKNSLRLHITTLKFTSFWEYIRSGDPIGINMLRDGIALLDTGFFDPLQILLMQGRIRPSTESIWNYFSMAPRTLLNSKWHLLQATVDLYWAVIDSAHAALMKVGEIPPSPEHVADILEKRFVKTGLLDRKYVITMRNFYHLSKMITHRELKEITGDQYDMYYKEASEFVEHMRIFIEKS